VGVTAEVGIAIGEPISSEHPLARCGSREPCYVAASQGLCSPMSLVASAATGGRTPPAEIRDPLARFAVDASRRRLRDLPLGRNGFDVNRGRAKVIAL